MQKEYQELLSSFMDGELTDSNAIESVSVDDDMQACWHRYHVARAAMRGKLHSCSLTLDISKAVSESIANDNLYNNDMVEQPDTAAVIVPKAENLFWIRCKDVITRVGQVGLAACVTLAVIAGVQYQQGQSTESNGYVLNTVPVGVNVAPVGGIQHQNDQQEALDKLQYDKIRLLVQDYELQKRLNAH